MRTIDPKEISVVVQGPLYRQLAPHRGIEACIASIHEHLPGAEVIVSTWQDEDVSGLDADLIIQSEDPGLMRDWSGNPINTNRQLVSTLAGLEISTRPYLMKFRSDHCLTSPALATIGEYVGAPPPHGRLFSTPVTITNLYIRDPVKCPMNYHASDIVQFGTQADMLVYWRHPIFSYSDLFNDKPSLNPFGNFSGYSAMKMTPEQAYMTNVLQKHGLDIGLSRPCQMRTSDLKLWEAVLNSDLSVIDWNLAGVDFPPRFQISAFGVRTIISPETIQRVAHSSPAMQRLRRGRIWLNQYVFNCLTPHWWKSLATIALFAISPPLAMRIRRKWRKVMNIQHPSPEKI
jgi:hypothetical protein